jgi:hypothetical protein
VPPLHLGHDAVNDAIAKVRQAPERLGNILHA